MNFPHKVTMLTKDGLDTLKARLDIIATQQKDLYAMFKENSEVYDKEKSFSHSELKSVELLEDESLKLSNILRYAKTIVRNEHPAMIELGSTATVKHKGKFLDITVVAPVEMDLANYKISEESPLGLSLLRKRIGDSFEVITTNGISNLYKVTAIR